MMNYYWDYNDVNSTKLQIDTNNTYAIGQTAALSRIAGKYDIVDLSNDCAACPSIND